MSDLSVISLTLNINTIYLKTSLFQSDTERALKNGHQ